MKTIDITDILSSDLKSRVRAGDLKLFIENSGETDVVIDFSNVKFATRSFIDEFYNLFLKTPDNNIFSIRITNIPEDINKMIESVSKTQTKAKTVKASAKVSSFKDVDELMNVLSSIPF